MSDGTGFGAFALFNAIKLHFTTKSYNYFKYNAKTNVTQDMFMKNKGKYSFYKLSRKYSMDELKNYYVSNFVYQDAKWIGDIMTTEGEACYMKWQKVNQSLTYKFKSDLEDLIEDDPESMLKVVDGQYPVLLHKTMAGDVAIETLAILNDLMKFFPMWNKKINDDIIWPNWCMKVEKYTPFMVYDKPKFKNILKEAVSYA